MRITFIHKLALACLISVHAVSAGCDGKLYGAPSLQSCKMVASKLPVDYNKRLFVDQELRARLSKGDWQPISDPRPQGFQEEIVQVPRWWNDGNKFWTTHPIV